MRWVAVLAVSVLLVTESSGAHAAEAYADQAKSTLRELLQGRDFKPEVGCRPSVVSESPERCTHLLEKLRAGDFRVISPDEQSEHPDMPLYLSVMGKCRNLHLVHDVVYAGQQGPLPILATRGFAMYRMTVGDKAADQDQTLVFRAHDYVLGDSHGPLLDSDGKPDHIAPGRFVAFTFPDCHQLASANATDGYLLGTNTPVGPRDSLSELVKIDDDFFVVNLTPNAETGEPPPPRSEWWYRLELWEWGSNIDKGVVPAQHIYAFTYQPPGTTK